jgi:hypothetical protein
MRGSRNERKERLKDFFAMTMKLIKKTDSYSIYQRGDERYAVKDGAKKPVNGDEKVRILLAEGLISVAEPSAAPEPEVAEEAAEEEAAEVETAEEAAADSAPASDEESDAQA